MSLLLRANAVVEQHAIRLICKCIPVPESFLRVRICRDCLLLGLQRRVDCEHVLSIQDYISFFANSWGFQNVKIIFGTQTFQISQGFRGKQMTNTIHRPSLYIANMEVSLEFARQINRVLEFPDRKMSITRNKDNKHLVTAGSVARSIGVPGEETTTRNNADYWHAPDLEELFNIFRRDGGGILTYIATVDKPKTDPTARIARFTTEFKVFVDEQGVDYRISRILDFQELSDRPLII